MLFTDKYLSIAEPTESNLRERGSRFLGFALPVNSEAAFKIELVRLRAQFPDATHHCWGLVLGPGAQFQKSSDDGEPSNSAGKPILRAILSQNLSDVGVIVVRYFGGTQLGVPGLINAYRNTAAEALAKAQRIDKLIENYFIVSVDYSYESDLWRFVKLLEARIINKWMTNLIEVEFAVPVSKSEKVFSLAKDFFHLKLQTK